jgi:hypothetical protein
MPDDPSMMMKLQRAGRPGDIGLRSFSPVDRRLHVFKQSTRRFCSQLVSSKLRSVHSVTAWPTDAHVHYIIDDAVIALSDRERLGLSICMSRSVRHACASGFCP